jgi:hypothetical protein
MANCETTTPIVIGPRLRSELWRELITTAVAHDASREPERRRELRSLYERLYDLLFDGEPDLQLAELVEAVSAMDEIVFGNTK